MKVGDLVKYESHNIERAAIGLVVSKPEKNSKGKMAFEVQWFKAGYDNVRMWHSTYEELEVISESR